MKENKLEMSSVLWMMFYNTILLISFCALLHCAY